MNHKSKAERSLSRINPSNTKLSKLDDDGLRDVRDELDHKYEVGLLASTVLVVLTALTAFSIGLLDVMKYASIGFGVLTVPAVIITVRITRQLHEVSLEETKRIKKFFSTLRRNRERIEF